MPSFYQESDLTFSFPVHWGVRKYDEQRFYLQMSGMGLKGVDFLLIDPIGEGHLYLVEVKNYRTRQHEGGTFTPTLKAPEVLAATLAAKYEHTVRAISAIRLYYQRKWWFRLFMERFQHSRRLGNDAIFWANVYRLVQQQTTHTAVLWLEQEVEEVSYEQALRQVLQYELPEGTKVELASEGKPWPVGVRVG